MRLSDWIELYREWENGLWLGEGGHYDDAGKATTK